MTPHRTERPADRSAARPADRRLSLVADIGGTNTRLALARGTELLPETIARCANRDQADLPSLIGAYLERQGRPGCDGACIALAGPVHDGVGALTNLDWRIDLETLARTTGAGQVAIVNDLQAQGHALDHLDPASVNCLLGARAEAPGARTRLVIGIGTGFNQAVVHDCAGTRLVPPSETGQSALPVHEREDIELLRHLSDRGGFASIEDVLSGPGLERLFAWQAARAGDGRRPDAAAVMRLIGRGDDAIAGRTAAQFARILGNVAGNLALIHLPLGGIYLAGGVARAFAPYLERYGFSAAFRRKGRFSDYMDRFSIRVIEDDWAALIGCAHHLAETAPTQG